MSDGTSIEWTDATWQVSTGCDRVSPECGTHEGGCYAERMAWRLSHNPATPQYQGVVRMTEHGARWTGLVKPFEDDLLAPLHWRKPRRVFVNSMSDLFHEDLPDAHIDRVFATMLACEVLENRTKHTFQVLTKRAERMRDYFRASPAELLQRWAKAADGRIILDNADVWFSEYVETLSSHRVGADGRVRETGAPWSRPENLFPLKNVWLGVSCGTRKHGLPRLDALRTIPASVRWVSFEPLLEDLGPLDLRGIEWVIVGGESGPGARPCHVAWIRRVVEQCHEQRVRVFVKQLGAYVIDRNDAGFEAETITPPDPEAWPTPVRVEEDLDGTRDGYQGAPVRVHLKNKKGGDMAEWPAGLRVREMPEVSNG